MISLDDAIQSLAKHARDVIEGRSMSQHGTSYGYDIYIPLAIKSYLAEKSQNGHAKLIEASPVFYDAAWQLCRRGILRPGIRKMDQQETPDGSAGNGYSVTPWGRAWLKQTTDVSSFVPVEPGRFATLIGRFHYRFGDGFFQRAQEASKCHFSTAYLACCVMCGAAAESIVLRLAIEKRGDEGEVLAIYRTAGGRGRVERIILDRVRDRLADQFRTMTDLLKYWRDNASHGVLSEISEFEAMRP